MLRIRMNHGLHALALTVAFGMAVSSVGPTGAAPQTLQDDIDQASPGDTVWIAPGDYVRAVTVDKAITLVPQTPGSVRMAALSGSEATVVGVVFDGNLASEPGTLVDCRSGLSLIDCTFQGPVRGARIEEGASSVVFRGCSFSNLIEAMALEPGIRSLTLEGTQLVDCSVGLVSSDTLSCDGGTIREPAERCAGGDCGVLTLDEVFASGGDRQLTVSGDYVLRILDSRFEEPTERALSAEGVRLEMERTEVTSVGGEKTGVILNSVSGFIRSSQVFFFDLGIGLGDGGCSRYSDIEIGGSLIHANDIGNHRNLVLSQPEPVAAELNYWGRTDCAEVLARIEGQTVDKITDVLHVVVKDCSGTPTERTTWGRMKIRFGTPVPHERP
jgi:hypothetical protein